MTTKAAVKPAKLYFAPHACSLAPHIALREADLPFELVKLDFATRVAADGVPFAEVNPKGYVPALRLADGSVLTECGAILMWIAEQAPASRLAPAPGTVERARFHEMLFFISTELHKVGGVFYWKSVTDEVKAEAIERLQKRYDHIARGLEKRFLLGDDYTVADSYLFYNLRGWQKGRQQVLTGRLAEYYSDLAKRPAVKAALEAEGLEA